MLKKKYRIGRRDLERFFNSKSRSFRGELIVLRVKKNKIGLSRFAFIVSGPKSRGASLRNLARRRLSAAAEESMDTFSEGLDFVFFLKLPGRTVPAFAKIKEDVKNVLYKANLQ